jgi:hypothetical protein
MYWFIMLFTKKKNLSGGSLVRFRLLQGKKKVSFPSSEIAALKVGKKKSAKHLLAC